MIKYFKSMFSPRLKVWDFVHLQKKEEIITTDKYATSYLAAETKFKSLKL